MSDDEEQVALTRARANTGTEHFEDALTGAVAAAATNQQGGVDVTKMEMTDELTPAQELTKYKGSRISQGKVRKQIEYAWLRLRKSLGPGDTLPEPLVEPHASKINNLIDHLKGLMNTLENKYEQSTCSPHFLPAHMDEHDAFMDNYNMVLVRLKLPEAPPTPPSPTVSTAPVTPMVVQAPVGLPSISLDTFDGHLGKYQAFKRSFPIIMQASGASKELQVRYLRDSLKGDALKSLSHISNLCDLTLEELWEHLDAIYDHKELDYHHHLAKLMSMGAMVRCTSEAQTRGLYNFVKEHVTELRKCCQNPKAGDDFKMLLHRLLPDYLQRKVVKMMKASPAEYTMDVIIDLLDTHVQVASQNSLLNEMSSSASPFSTLKQKADGKTQPSQPASKVFQADVSSSQPCVAQDDDLPPLYNPNLYTPLQVPTHVGMPTYHDFANRGFEPQVHASNVQPTCSPNPLLDTSQSGAYAASQTNQGHPIPPFNQAPGPNSTFGATLRQDFPHIQPTLLTPLISTTPVKMRLPVILHHNINNIILT